MTDLPDHTIRESQRAKHVNLRISNAGELEVVIPRGFDRSLIPEILHKKRAWIERAKRRLAERQEFLPVQPILPEQIFLRAIGEVWRVDYRATPTVRITVTEAAGKRLVLSGNTHDAALCKLALRKWLAHQAHKHLVPWLRDISQTEGLPFKKVIIRGQKTRWGSYSARGTISLNYKLLLLPPALVRYVLVHELCHTRHLNHSKKFWALVDKKEPGYKQAKAELRTAWRYVPSWLQDG